MIRLTVTVAAVVLAAGTAGVARASTSGAARDGASAATVVIDGGRTYQRIAGFGAAEAFGEAESVRDAPAAAQKEALDLLYSRTGGAGLTILRNEISADVGTTIEPTAPSSPTAKPAYLSLSAINDDDGQLWFTQTIKKDYGVTDVFADAWSAPAFMKTNDSVPNGGTLCGVPGATCASGDWRQAYADYLTQYAKDYAAAGDPLSYVGPENEANIGPDYDSMIMSPDQTADFLDYLGPTLARSGLRTRTECCATEGWDYAQQYAAAIEADPIASRYTSVFTSHGYTEAPASPLAGWTKPAWESEWAQFGASWDPAWDDGTASSGFTWAQNIYTALTAANVSAFLFWEGIDPNNGNGGLVFLDNGTPLASGRLWAFANFSRFVRPGAIRVGTSTADGDLDVAAFRNINGSAAIVVLNTATTAQTASFSLRGTGATRSAVTPYLTDATHDTARQHRIRVGDGLFTATVPARALVTYYLPAAR
jgi:O-glycosyl hydrolase